LSFPLFIVIPVFLLSFPLLFCHSRFLSSSPFFYCHSRFLSSSPFSFIVIPAFLLSFPLSFIVIPAKAGIHSFEPFLDPRLRGDDILRGLFNRQDTYQGQWPTPYKSVLFLCHSRFFIFIPVCLLSFSLLYCRSLFFIFIAVSFLSFPFFYCHSRFLLLSFPLSFIVIPAKAGIHSFEPFLDPRLRGDDIIWTISGSPPHFILSLSKYLREIQIPGFSSSVFSPSCSLVLFVRMWGKRMTSRIDAESVRIITSLSIPMPSPAAGGMPYSRARI